MAVRISTLFGGGNAVHKVVCALTPYFSQHGFQCRFITVQIVGYCLPTLKKIDYLNFIIVIK